MQPTALHTAYSCILSWAHVEEERRGGLADDFAYLIARRIPQWFKWLVFWFFLGAGQTALALYAYLTCNWSLLSLLAGLRVGDALVTHVILPWLKPMVSPSPGRWTAIGYGVEVVYLWWLCTTWGHHPLFPFDFWWFAGGFIFFATVLFQVQFAAWVLKWKKF